MFYRKFGFYFSVGLVISLVPLWNGSYFKFFCILFGSMIIGIMADPECSDVSPRTYRKPRREDDSQFEEYVYYKHINKK